MQITIQYHYALLQNHTGIQHQSDVKHARHLLRFIIRYLIDVKSALQHKFITKPLDLVRRYVKVVLTGTQQLTPVFKILYNVQSIMSIILLLNYARNALKEMFSIIPHKNYVWSVHKEHIQISQALHVMLVLIKLHTIIKPSFVTLLHVILANFIVLLQKLVLIFPHVEQDNISQFLMKSA